jgi:hypothetical protein
MFSAEPGPGAEPHQFSINRFRQGRALPHIGRRSRSGERQKFRGIGRLNRNDDTQSSFVLFQRLIFKTVSQGEDPTSIGE